jgi:hypothetical protein
MNLVQIGSVALRPSAWLTGSSAPGNTGDNAVAGHADQRVETRRVAIDSTPAEVPHRFWHGLMFALPLGIAFWVGVYFVFLR